MFGFFKEFKVHITKDSQIIFPETCVVCGEKCLNEEVEITGIYYPGGWFIKKYFSTKPKMNVPIHETCNKTINSKDAIRDKVGMVIVLFYLGMTTWLEKDFLFMVIGLIPVMLINHLFNTFWYVRPFQFSIDQYRYKFIFGNAQIAAEFKELNKDNLFDIGNLFDFKN